MLAKALLLFIVWIGLSNSLHYQELIVGAVVSVFIVYFFSDKSDIDLKHLLFKYLRFTPLFLKNLILSNIEVAKIVLNPKLPINPGIIKLKMTSDNEYDQLLLANAITLTPGTITLELRENFLYIHILDLKSVDEKLLYEEILQEYEMLLKS
ncbi:MAG: Na+/H+ antiporter subunit E [Campylobacterota bacterium]|nr:Na+/H+ antiporter subunit E [Campylobacterota bacterium]